MSSREHYAVTATNLNDLVMALNFALARIADRLDKMEGARGNPEFLSDVDMGGNKIEDLARGTSSTDGVILSQVPGQGLEAGDSPTFESLTLEVGLVLPQVIFSSDIRYYDADNVLLHGIGDVP